MVVTRYSKAIGRCFLPATRSCRTHYCWIRNQEKADENSVATIILDKLKSQNISYEDNWFIFAEENPVLREDFVQAMKNKGYYTDTSHNKEIIKVKAVAILDFLTEKKDENLLKQLASKADFSANLWKLL